MALRVLNTLTRSQEEFQPLVPGRVGMYVCGPTVYDSAHLGHARSAITFDVVRRYLRFSGYEVRLIRNLTDVDDKIIQRARREGVDWRAIVRRYADEYVQDMHDLGLEPPDVQPPATDHIEAMQNLIARLIERGAAYAVDGDVFFSVEAFPRYGRLSGQDRNEVRAGSRVEVDERKRAPEDFALWKSAKPDDPSWPSPWGLGRPGWHIECSAMAEVHLGIPFDIHGGGSDLVFPHHENEIAQSEAASGRTFARVWMHNGMVQVNHVKMSKSLDNFFTVRDLLDIHDAETIRLFVLSQHYRSPVDFTLEGLEESRKALTRAYATLARVDRGAWGSASKSRTEPASTAESSVEGDWPRLESAFRDGMDDDFNSARAIATIFDGVRALNRTMDVAGSNAGASQRSAAQAGRDLLARLGSVLGILESDPAAWLRRDRDRQVERRGPSTAWIEECLEARAQARREKRWPDADAIRVELARTGILVEDRPDGGTEWTVVDVDRERPDGHD